MSLGRLFKEMALAEDGVLRARGWRWVFVRTEAQFERLIGAFVAFRRDQTDDFARRVITKRDDERGRPVAVKHRATSYACPDVETYGEDHPVIDGRAWVPVSVCAKCPNRVRSRVQRSKWSCKILREKRRGLTKEAVKQAVKTADDLLGTPSPGRPKDPSDQNAK